jgi:hypothetical protein
MSDQDQLAEIKATLHYWDAMYAQHGLTPLPPAVAAQEAARHVNRAQVDWLVKQADLAFELGDLLPRKELTITRLRDLLGRLEWAEQGYNCVGYDEICPVCNTEKDTPHVSGCWLAEVLRPGTPNDPPRLPKE